MGWKIAKKWCLLALYCSQSYWRKKLIFEKSKSWPNIWQGFTWRLSFYLETSNARVPWDVVMEPAWTPWHTSTSIAAQQPLLAPHLLVHLQGRARYGRVPWVAHHQLALRTHLSLLHPWTPSSHPLSTQPANSSWAQKFKCLDLGSPGLWSRKGQKPSILVAQVLGTRQKLSLTWDQVRSGTSLISRRLALNWHLVAAGRVTWPRRAAGLRQPRLLSQLINNLYLPIHGDRRIFFKFTFIFQKQTSWRKYVIRKDTDHPYAFNNKRCSRLMNYNMLLVWTVEHPWAIIFLFWVRSIFNDILGSLYDIEWYFGFLIQYRSIVFASVTAYSRNLLDDLFLRNFFTTYF